MQIRIQNISQARGLRLKAIARVKFGQTSVPEFVKIILADFESRYGEEEMKRIMDLYEKIKDED